MPSAYEVHLRQEAFQFLLSCRRSDREAILAFLHRLAVNPFQGFDFEERDPADRPIFGVIFRRWAIIYWCEHLSQELRVVDIRLAD